MYIKSEAERQLEEAKNPAPYKERRDKDDRKDRQFFWIVVAAWVVILGLATVLR